MAIAGSVANYILSLSNPDEGDIISHLKLQKLLYYSQGFFLALYDRPLFLEPIEHWDHGPVVPTIYQHYKVHEANALPVPSHFNFSSLTGDEKSVIEEVYDIYGQFSAWKLRQMTHREPPWVDTDSCEQISHASLTHYFKTQLIE